MGSLFSAPLDSPLVIGLTIAFFITSAITTFDKRLNQARQLGLPLLDEPPLPWWVEFIAWFHWGLFLALLLLDWKYALVLFVIKFVLSVLPVLEIIGNILMAPFRSRH